MIVHVYPVNDTYPHTTGDKRCACKPRITQVEGGGIVVCHNSYDGREILENCEVCDN